MGLTGDITATRRQDGSVRLDVIPGTLRVTRLVVEQADPEYLNRHENLITFHSVEDDGSCRSYRYRVEDYEPGEFEGGWIQLEPVA